MNKPGVLRFVVIGVLSLYPLFVYFGIQRFGVGVLALVLLAVILMRLSVIKPAERKFMLPLLLFLAAYAGVTALCKSQLMLLAYPVLINLSLALWFGLSLRTEEPILLRMVRARKMDTPAHAIPYLRRLTAVWTVFFVLNAVVAFITIHLSMAVWTLYNGLLSYVIIALLLGGEMVFRHYYKRRVGD